MQIRQSCIMLHSRRAGVTARQRKDELERLNEQLRKINMSLRQQARTMPGLKVDMSSNKGMTL